MRIWLELNQKEGEQVFNLLKEFNVDRMKTAVMSAPKEAETRKETFPDNPITIEQVRSVLAEKARSGKHAEIKDIINRHGASKLTEVDPADYETILKEVEDI